MPSKSYIDGFRNAARGVGIRSDSFAKYAAESADEETRSADPSTDEMSYMTTRNVALARLKPRMRREMQWIDSAPQGATGYMSQDLLKEFSDFTDKYGYIDPRVLAKSAQALGTLVRPFTRYWELLAGSGKALRHYKALGGKIDGLLETAIAKKNADSIRKLRKLRGQLDVAANNNKMVLNKDFWNRMSEFGIAPEGKMWQNGLLRAGEDGSYRFNHRVTSELDKMLATRFGTGGAVLGGGYMMFGPRGEEDQP